MTIQLSKSKLIAFRQCPKRLWLEIHWKGPIEVDASAKRRFEVGRQVGALARTQYQDGFLISTGGYSAHAASETKARLLETPRKAIFEGAFETQGIRVQADLLVPVKNGWHMVEVKSGTEAKNYQIEDAAIQCWVVRKAGLTLANTSLQLIDSKWTFPGGLDYSGLLKSEVVDDLIQPLQKDVPKWLKAAQGIVSGAEPKVRMGRQCNDPFVCEFQGYCESLTTPVQFPITWLPHLNANKLSRFEAAGVSDLRNLVPDDLTDKQQRVRHATINNEAHFEPLTAKEKKAFSGTRYYLDFETIAFAVPIWPETRPYQQIPFQWSCHIEKTDGTLSHEMFLDLSGNDPSRRFAESLLRTVGRSGPIIVYNQAFEKRIISELAARFTDLAPALNKLLGRVVDLLPLTREHYYHPDMRGSWSIKDVLPTIAPELDYANLDVVADGGGAQDAYLEATHDAIDDNRKFTLEYALRLYCCRDTEAMKRLLEFLCHKK